MPAQCPDITVTLQDLNELQAYILIRRWSSSQASPPAQLSTEQLQELQAAYFLQRSYLLRSIEELLAQSGAKQYAQRTSQAVRVALDAGLEHNLSQALFNNFAKPATEPFNQHKHSSPTKQQSAYEQELLLSILLSLYCIWVPCQRATFKEIMQTLDKHVFQASTQPEVVSKTACLVSRKSLMCVAPRICACASAWH